MRWTLLVTLCLSFGWSGVALAQGSGGKVPAPACKADIEKYCSKVLPGQGRIFACIQGNEDRIQPQCKASMNRGRQAASTFIQACGMDVAKLCGDVKSGKGRVAKCLKAKTDQVSAGCKKYGANLDKDVENFEKACAADRKKHCKGVRAGMGRIYRCLNAKQAKLSPSCKSQFSGK